MKGRRFYLVCSLVAAAFVVSTYHYVQLPRSTPPQFASIAENGRLIETVDTENRTSPSQGEPARQLASASPSKTQLPRKFQSLADEIKRLQACYDAECDYSRSYPRDYDYAVGRDLKKTIYALQSLVEEEGLIDSELEKIARDNLANEDGHVKEAALHLLATQPTTEEALNSLLRDVILESDAELVEHAMLELQRYKSAGDLKSIRETLAQAMLTGAPFVSEAVSKYIVSFIDTGSYVYFSEIATRLSAGSRVKTNLQFSLAEFRRRATGA